MNLKIRDLNYMVIQHMNQMKEINLNGEEKNKIK